MQVFDGPTVTIANCTFSNNQAYYGGAIYVSTNSTVNIGNGSTFISNSGVPGGGAIRNDGTATLTNTTLSANHVTGSEQGYSGGGIFNVGSLTLTNVTLDGNQAPGGSGGGIFNTQGSATLTNVTLSGNSADSGGAIYTETQLQLQNVTMSGNSARITGGIFQAPSKISVSIANTVIAKGASGGNCSLTSYTTSGNLSDDGTCGFTTTSEGVARDGRTDLLLGPLANNGGLAKTHLPQPGSFAIDHGTPDGAPGTDQRGIKRPQLAGVDVGAVEVVPPIFQDTDPSIHYDNWNGIGDLNASGGSFRFSSHANDTVTYKFNATSIKWITTKGSGNGKALVTIDGVNKGTFDLYNTTPLWNQQFLFSGLASAAHTMVIKVTGTKSASSSGYNVAMDGFLVGASTKPVQENAVAVQYNKWIGKKQAAASGGSYRINSSIGFATLDFTGTSVSFITARGPSYGKVSVGIDGVFVLTNLDLYAATQQWQYKVGIAGLTNGPHTIEIDTTHSKNASSSGYGVVLDAIEAFQQGGD